MSLSASLKTFGPFDLPLPQGEPSTTPRSFDEVAPVVVAFVRSYLSAPHAQWYQRKGSSHEFLVHGDGCGAGGTNHNEGWLDLVSAPVLLIDEGIEHLSKPIPRNSSDFVALKTCPPEFPESLRGSILLTIENDLMVMAQKEEEIRTYLAMQNALPKSDRDSEGKINKHYSQLSAMTNVSTCLDWRIDWLNNKPVARSKMGPR